MITFAAFLVCCYTDIPWWVGVFVVLAALNIEVLCRDRR